MGGGQCPPLIFFAKGDTIKNLDGMLSAMMRFMQSLEEDADSQEEVQLIKKYARKMSEM